MSAMVRRQFEGGKMLDELKEEAIVNKVGGRFKLSTLIQKRMRALNRGALPLVKVRGGDMLSIAIQEILQDKIYLDLSGQLQTCAPSAGDAARRAMFSDVSD
jgi:DNA-directed RNA polymerase subunit omega